MNDTTADIARRQLEIYQRLDGSARLRLAFEMTAMARELAIARLRAEHPSWTPEMLNRELLRCILVSEPVPPQSHELP